MKYKSGSIGKVIVARFDDGDNILQGLAEIVRKENIRAGILYLVGGIKGGKIVVGPEKDELPPAPVWRNLEESHESLGIGTVFWHGGEPKIHFHGAYGKHDKVKVGCLREFAETFIIMEAIILELKGIDATRELDPLSQMVLLKLKD